MRPRTCPVLALVLSQSVAHPAQSVPFPNTRGSQHAHREGNGRSRPDPYGLDANYDPRSGWAWWTSFAVKEALNSTSGVQGPGACDRASAGWAHHFHWITQREYPSSSASRVPAPEREHPARSSSSRSPIAPAGDPNIQGDDNRTPYTYEDSDDWRSADYWYRVEWLDRQRIASQPPRGGRLRPLARRATVHYSIVHNAAQRPHVRVGSDRDRMPGVSASRLRSARTGRIQRTAARDPATGGAAHHRTSTVGTIEHFGRGFTRRRGGGLLPRARQSVVPVRQDGGFVNRRVACLVHHVRERRSGQRGCVTYVTTTPAMRSRHRGARRR